MREDEEVGDTKRSTHGNEVSQPVALSLFDTSSGVGFENSSNVECELRGGGSDGTGFDHN